MLHLVTLLLWLAVGCKDELTRNLSSLADRACACTDRACAEKARADLDALLRDFTEPPKSNATRIAALLSKASACIDDALQSGH
jgi:hypothetical protein